MKIKFLLFNLILFGIVYSCERNNLSEVRKINLDIEKVVENYRFCMYEKENSRMEKKVYNIVIKKHNDDFFEYFHRKSIYNKSVISMILVRNLCRIRDYYGNSQKGLNDQRFQKLLNNSIDEIRREINGINFVKLDKSRRVIFEGRINHINGKEQIIYISRVQQFKKLNDYKTNL